MSLISTCRAKTKPSFSIYNEDKKAARARTMVTDWTDAYTNGAYIPDGDTYPQRWAEEAAISREELKSHHRVLLGISYGPKERNKFDLFLPNLGLPNLALPISQPKGLVSFMAVIGIALIGRFGRIWRLDR
jgi:hypothetical protein